MVRKRFVALAATLLLGACEVDSEHEVFFSEVQDIATGVQDSGNIQSTFRMSMPSRTECERLRPTLVQIFGRYHQAVSAGECSAAGFFASLTLTANMPIVGPAASSPPGTNIFALAVAPEPRDGSFYLRAMLERQRLEQLRREIRAINSDTGRENLIVRHVSLTLHNDGVRPVLVRAPSAFLNREPAMAVSSTLVRRAKLEIRLSDVGVAQLNQSGLVLIMNASNP